MKQVKEMMLKIATNAEKESTGNSTKYQKHLNVSTTRIMMEINVSPNATFQFFTVVKFVLLV